MKCGAIFSEYDARDYQLIYTASAQEFPEQFELKTREIKNQGSVGSCVAHSLASIIEIYNYNQTGQDDKMSVGYIYGNRRNTLHKGEGMVVRDALGAVCKMGDVEYSLFPYNKETPEIIDMFEEQADALYQKSYPNRISQYCRVFTSSAIKSALMAGNPVLMAMTWYGDMKVDADGILRTNFADNQGGHCMFIYGWDKNGWKVQNSWGNNWGIDGKMIIPYDIPIVEFWTITDDIVDNTTIKKPFSSTIGKFIAKIINKIVNIFKFK